MAVAPTVQNSTEPTTDELSPTTLILNALKKAGQQPTNENIRRYVEAMGRQGDQSGIDIPGLRVQQQDDGDGPAVGRRGNVSTKIESVTTPPARGGTPDTPPDRSPAPGTTSAPPAGDGSLSPDYYLGATGNESPSGLAALILGGGAAGGAGAYGLSKLRNWGLGSGAGPMPDPGAGVPTSSVPRPGEPGGNPGEIDYTQLDPGRGSGMAEPPVSPMTAALNEATAPRTGVPTVGEGVPPMPDIGPVPQPRIPAGPGSAVLPPDLGSPPPQTIPSGPNTQVLPQNMPENAPRVPMPNRVGAAPTPADFYHPSWKTLGPLARSILGHVK